MCALQQNRREAAPRSIAAADRFTTKAAEGTRINLSGMRKGIAERLVASKGAGAAFLSQHRYRRRSADGRARGIEIRRRRHRRSKITVNDFVLKAAVHGRSQSSQGERVIR